MSPMRPPAPIRLGVWCISLTVAACGGAERTQTAAPGSLPVAPSGDGTVVPGEADRKPSATSVRVGDTELTRDLIVREVGPKESDEDDASYEGRIHARWLKAALRLVLAQAQTGDAPSPIPPQDPSPEEARRLFERHPRAFDEPYALQFSLFSSLPVDRVEEGKRTFDEATEEARERMEALLAESARGEPAATLATKYGLGREGAWRTSEGFEPAPPPRVRGLLEAWMQWLFDPTRRPGERKVFDAQGGVIVGLAVHAVRPARPRTFEEARDDVIRRMGSIREAKRGLRHRLTLLAAASIQPPSISEELEAQAREELRRLDDDPVGRDIEVP